MVDCFIRLSRTGNRSTHHPPTLTMAKEGPQSTELIDFCNWYACAIHGVNLHLWSRTSVDFKVNIDPNAVLAATSVEIDGQRIQLNQWDLGPDRLEDDGSQRVEKRKAVHSKWVDTTTRNKTFHTHFVKSEENLSSGESFLIHPDRAKWKFQKRQNRDKNVRADHKASGTLCSSCADVADLITFIEIRQQFTKKPKRGKYTLDVCTEEC